MTENHKSRPLLVRDAMARGGPLAELLRGLPGDAPLTLSGLAPLARAKPPQSRLAACLIILDYLRVKGK